MYCCVRLCGCIVLWRLLFDVRWPAAVFGAALWWVCQWFSMMCSELQIMLEISCPLWSSMCEYNQTVKCAFTSHVSIESGMLVACRMQYAMSVSTVL